MTCGSSNYDFYFNAPSTIKSGNTLKKWHYQLTSPDYKNIKAMSTFC